MFGEELPQGEAGRRVCFRNFRRRALGDDPAARLAPFGAEVDHPVRVRDDVEVVLDHEDRAAGVDEPREHAREARHIRHVKAHGRLVKNVERALRAPPERAVRADLRKLRDELDALRLASGERGRGLPEREVPEAHVRE